MDILDEKFAITAFIAWLGIQSKDLMFSISKNPQASMVEVLSKAEKYINGEEALMSKREALPRERRKVRMSKTGPNPQKTKRQRQRQIPTEEQGRQRLISEEMK